MDYSAFTEPQPPQTQYQSQPYDLQQQQSQPYDHTQLQPQPYDQTYYSYYQNPNPQYADPSQPYPYYPDYAGQPAPDAFQQPLPPSQPDANLQPPGISAPPPEASHVAGPHFPHHDPNPVPSGLNPAAAAAVAALSQLQQFAGSMAMQERQQWPPANPQMGGPHPPPFHHGGDPFRPQIGRAPYRGSGRRSGRSLRGRNTFGSHSSRSDSGSPHFRGRGRISKGGGGGRKFPQSGSAPPAQEPGLDPSMRPAPPAQALQPAPPQRIPQNSWCELCMVDCNTLEILEQHMNGKRHKKNVQRHQEFENHKKMMAEIQQKSVVSEQPQPEPEPQPQPQSLQPQEPQPENEVWSGALEEEKKLSSAVSETLPPTSIDETAKMETEIQQQGTGEQSDEPKVDPSTDSSTALVSGPIRGRGRGRGRSWDRGRGRGRGYWDDRRHAPKRGNTSFGRGAKRPRMSEGMEEHPPMAQKVPEEPKFCALCNVKCDTQLVFETHLAGKKHAARLKQSQGRLGSYGLHSYKSSHPQPAAGYVPRGFNQPIIYGHQGQEMVKDQLVTQQGVLEAPSEPRAEINSEPFQWQETVAGAGSQEASLVTCEAQIGVTVDPTGHDAVMVVPNGQFSDSKTKVE